MGTLFGYLHQSSIASPRKSEILSLIVEYFENNVLDLLEILNKSNNILKIQ